MLNRRAWLAGLFVATLAATAAGAQEPYPSRVVKIVLPVAPGSTTDILARLVANELSQTWGKPVIVENMPGAAMNIGSEYVAHAEPDGYTLLICPPSPLSIQQLLFHDLKYDWIHRRRPSFGPSRACPANPCSAWRCQPRPTWTSRPWRSPQWPPATWS
jgi:tripartite-type tricarboxylate transporter receptor subunit TctC